MRNPLIKPIIAILSDILLAIVVLLIFAYLFLGKDVLLSFGKTASLPDSNSEMKTTAASPQPTAEPVTDEKTDWQVKFADKFSDSPVYSDGSYTSSNISITISSETYSNDNASFLYHIADIYIGDINCLRTFTIGQDVESSSSFNILDINQYTGAIVSINGDACVWQSSGLIIRNGEGFNNGITTCNGKELVLTYDGEMKYAGEFSDYNELIENAYQIWNFGPAILDADGHSYRPTIADNYIAKCHPRTAIGYYEPGHYCFIVVDGRQNDSDGCYLEDLGDLMESLGCKLAYNLDGGSSSMLAFNGEIVSSPSADFLTGGVRALSDTIYISEVTK